MNNSLHDLHSVDKHLIFPLMLLASSETSLPDSESTSSDYPSVAMHLLREATLPSASDDGEPAETPAGSVQKATTTQNAIEDTSAHARLMRLLHAEFRAKSLSTRSLAMVLLAATQLAEGWRERESSPFPPAACAATAIASTASRLPSLSSSVTAPPFSFTASSLLSSSQHSQHQYASPLAYAQPQQFHAHGLDHARHPFYFPDYALSASAHSGGHGRSRSPGCQHFANPNMILSGLPSQVCPLRKGAFNHAYAIVDTLRTMLRKTDLLLR